MARANWLNPTACAFWCLVIATTILPIGLGGNRPIPLGLAQAGLALCSFFLVTSRNVWAEFRLFSRLRWAIFLFCVVALWAYFQTQPYAPIGWTHPIWTEAATVLKVPVHPTIAVSPEDSLKGLSDYITYIAAGLLAYILAQDPLRARKLVQVLWLTGAATCVYGLIVYFTGTNKILWFEKWAYQGDLTGTFVNRNHFAIYAGMMFVSGAAILMHSWEHGVQRMKAHQRVEALRNWLTTRGIPYGLLLGLIFLSILFSHSRAGLVLTILGMGSYIFFYQIYIGAWKRAISIGVVVVVILAVVLFIAMQFSDRFSVLFSDYSSLDRLHVYKLALHIIQDNPVLGYGLNGFEPEFRLYQQYMLMEFNHAHSDILESLVDLGIPFGLLLWAAIILLLSGLWHGIRSRRRDGLFPALGLAVSLMALGHALVDFDLQIPGVAVTWAVLLGAGLAQSWTHAEKRKDAT